MEDRLTEGLYLEMSDLAARDYRDRASEVRAAGSVTGLTLWENLVPDRTDLPRRLPEFHLLAVYEVGGSFSAPAGVPPGVRGHHFRRYPRPGQGRLTARPTLGLSLVLISPKQPEPDAAQALRDWGDFVHISHIAAAAVPGFTMITPYERVGGGEPRFLHFYEMDTADAEGAFQRMPRVVEARIGGQGTPGWDEWAWHPALRIDYVNSFRRLDDA